MKDRVDDTFWIQRATDAERQLQAAEDDRARLAHTLTNLRLESAHYRQRAAELESRESERMVWWKLLLIGLIFGAVMGGFAVLMLTSRGYL